MEIGGGITLLMPLVGVNQADLKKLDKGTGSATFTRATTATRLNPDTNQVASVASGDAREDGRKYLNLLEYSEDISQGSWSKQAISVASNVVVAPNGKQTADSIKEDSTNNYHYMDQSVSYVYGRPYTFSIYLKKGNKTWCWLDFPTNALLTWFNFDTGQFGQIAVGVTASATSLAGGWYRIDLKYASAPASGHVGAGLASANGVGSYTGNGTDYMYLWGAKLEEGSSVTRYKKSGSSPAYAPKGVLIEGQRTNLLLYSRNMTNAAWTKTNMTAALDQTGEDGAANSASSLLATLANATCLQALTQASNQFSGSISIMRLIGTGAVSITLDGGATWVDVTSSLSTLVWYRALKENQTLANPSFGIKLATSGDKVAVDYAGVEQAVFASSRIPTTSAAVTRNADVLTVPSSGNAIGTLGSCFAVVSLNQNVADYFYAIDLGLSSPSIAHYVTQYFYARDGVNSVVGAAWIDLLTHHVVSRWSGSTLSIMADGGTLYNGTFDGDMNVSVNLTIGANGSGGNELFGHIKYPTIYNRAPTDAEMQAVTATT